VEEARVVWASAHTCDTLLRKVKARGAFAMKLTAQVKLLPTPQQAELLKQTLEQANTVCNTISDYAWENKTFGQYTLHEALYHDLREQFKLAAQVVIRCLSKVADAYKLDRKQKRHFKPLGSIAYDSRILAYRIEDRERAHVSIWTVEGRQCIPIVCGNHHWRLLKSQEGESDLVYRDGQFYLYTTCGVEEREEQPFEEALGVDLGVTNIAVDSDGEVYTANSNAHINTIRHRYRKLRQKLQEKGTKAAKRLLRKRARRERRFAKDTNHCISKRIVAKAQGTGRAIALEDLEGIRARVTVKRHQRSTLHSWSFHDLRQKVAYKAKLVGVPVTLVDPRNTSRACPFCGCVDKRNRRTQASFSCVVCGFSGFADHVAAINIGRRAAVNRPYVSDAGFSPPPSGGQAPAAPGTSHRLSAGSS
jgi:putative transposase